MVMPNALKAKMVAGTALVLLFGSGVVVGLAWDQAAGASTPREVRTDGRSEREGGRRRMIVDNVGLSAVQKSTVDSLVVFHRHRMADLDKEFRPRYRAVIHDLLEDIKQVLTDEQRMQYNVLLAERDGARAERRNKFGKIGP
jgi:Spy/CpxP family protein refolding chaperone